MLFLPIYTCRLGRWDNTSNIVLKDSKKPNAIYDEELITKPTHATNKIE